jgi:hypothetical protein
MPLPPWGNAASTPPEKTLVAKEKIEDYLLNGAHPDNGGKAQFFDSLGFRYTL